MSRHRRGRITVQHQPTGSSRTAMRMMGGVHAIFGGVFVIVAITQIMPNAGIIGLPFLAGGAFFCFNGIRMAVSKNGLAHRVGYDVETGIEEETIMGLMDEIPASGGSVSPVTENHNRISPVGSDPRTRLEQLEDLKSAGLITEQEYKEKRSEILDEL